MAASREPFNVSERSPSTTQQHSPWHSPVPYLFGGLAAMLGLIAFALLILACSYWKLSGYLDSGDGNSQEPDLEAGEGKGENTQKPQTPVFEEKILVIMAGQVKPTFLATPMSSRASSFGDGSKNGSEIEKSEKLDETEESVRQSGSDRLQSENRETETQSSSDQHSH